MNNPFSNRMATNPASTRRTSLFTATLSVLALTLGVGLMPAFAQEENTVIDEQAIVKSSESLLSMSMYNDADGLIINITGIVPTQIDKIFFDGIDVSDLVSNLVTQGVAKITETENAYTLQVAIPSQIEGEHTLGITTVEGLLFSKKMLVSKYQTEKYSSIGALSGFAYTKNSSWSFSTLLKSSTIFASYCSKGFCYTVSTKTKSDGSYTVSCENQPSAGSSSKDKGSCYNPDTVSFFYYTGSGRNTITYVASPINLKSPLYYANRYDPVMVKR